jgi:hypothetical protein
MVAIPIAIRTTRQSGASGQPIKLDILSCHPQLDEGNPQPTTHNPQPTTIPPLGGRGSQPTTENSKLPKNFQ